MSTAPQTSPTDPCPSPERFVTLRTPQGDLELCYQTFGDPADETVLLVMGLGGPMTWWDAAFCQRLADRGFHVVRYDNRDTGRSSRVQGRVTLPGIVGSFLGRSGPPPYTLVDMADDAFGLLDHLGSERAHVVGISMGGMIAQTMTVARPGRVRSLTSIMSTTGRRTVGWQDPRLLPMLVARRAHTRESYVAASARLWKVIGSPLYPDRAEDVQERAGETWDRGVSASGVARQMKAILSAPDRTRPLRDLDVPSLVIHGTSDRMVHVSGGRATSQALRGSELLLVPGMGHDVPKDLHVTFVDAIERTARRAS
ncbi:alpha/beta fold hydrolase [Nocardioides iriomotensis]|uniref:Alpha/beta hydrolase n=1 Tax=Nocardioides iriomotensis TaxID=715784 RepID=A0A4Q5J8F7_9ACTN|nr:alpha/beta hydrolase [Nocardioides iriomotensis]RYU14198.1 alpha/beta hydrolase [Nocardioides iriomotensis]